MARRNALGRGLGALIPDEPTAQTSRGGEMFNEVGCDKCHLPLLRGPRGGIPAYTDLLLHDMGDDLADRFPMGVAAGSEFRTQPLAHCLPPYHELALLRLATYVRKA